MPLSCERSEHDEHETAPDRTEAQTGAVNTTSQSRNQLLLDEARIISSFCCFIGQPQPVINVERLLTASCLSLSQPDDCCTQLDPE